MCKSSVCFYSAPPPIFGWGPLTSFGLAKALLVACGYLVPTVFLETRNWKFSNIISDVNVFCLLLRLPFPALKKKVFLEYVVLSRNTDCALLFDGFAL